MRASCIVAALLGVALVAACRNGPPSAVASGGGSTDQFSNSELSEDAQVSTSTILSLSDSGAAVTIKAGATLVIKLPSGPSTGYVWELTSVDRNVLDLAGPPTHEREAGPDVDASNRVFSFVAKGSGSTHLEIAHHRPWESAPAHRTFVLDVTVK